MKRSRGFWTKKSRKSAKSVREKGVLPPTKVIKQFGAGDSVNIKIESSFHNGIPHPRFHGRTGRVVGKRGRAYLVKVRDGRKEKTVISHPVHLSLQRS